MGKYFKAEQKYFLATKMYIYYGVWVASAILTLLFRRLEYAQYSSSTDVNLVQVILPLFGALLSMVSFVAPIIIIILFVQSITSAFTEGAYRNVFSLNISRTKWLSSKVVVYLLAYLCGNSIIKIFNELIILTYPKEAVLQTLSSIFVFQNTTVTCLFLLVEVSFILMYHGLATWLGVLLKKTVPVILIIVFGTIVVQIFSGIIFAIVMSLTLQSGGTIGFFAYPLPGNFYGLISLVYIGNDVNVAYLNLGLTAVFQLAYAGLFYFLGYRKINRIDF